MQVVTKEAGCTFITSVRSRILGKGGPGKCFFFFQPGLLNYFLILLILSVVGCWLSGAGVDCLF